MSNQSDTPRVEGEAWQERFWSKVDKNSPAPKHNPTLGNCWEWIAGRTIKGYGQLVVNHKTVKAHRLSWELSFKEIPKGLSVLHKCDNPSCVNPDHLFLGNHSDNMRDASIKGRLNAQPGEV